MTLRVANLHAGYGPVAVLHGVDLAVAGGEVLCLMGRNGAGKSTTLKAVMGLVRATKGEVRLDATRLDTLPAHAVPRAGVAWVPQGRRLFAELTVAENLEVGLLVRGGDPAARAETRGRALGLFPRLRERLSQVSGTLSGGEQQMLAIARALCTAPRVLLLDEPTEGLQPSMIALIHETVLRLKAAGVATILVEQRVDAALAVADRIAFLDRGRVAETLPAAGLTREAAAFRSWVGV
jgi:branched-chain amino acid transport system ATP-binding protein